MDLRLRVGALGLQDNLIPIERLLVPIPHQLRWPQSGEHKDRYASPHIPEFNGLDKMNHSIKFIGALNIRRLLITFEMNTTIRIML